jgi:hypothetical protein
MLWTTSERQDPKIAVQIFESLYGVTYLLELGGKA